MYNNTVLALQWNSSFFQTEVLLFSLAVEEIKLKRKVKQKEL
jgi:hypothetical protein